MDYKVEMLKFSEGLYTCVILRDKHILAHGGGVSKQDARQNALYSMTVADFTDFMDWYARQQKRPWPPTWLMVLLACALVVLVVFLVAWSVAR